MLSDLTGRIRTRFGSTSLAVRAGQRVYARCLGLVAGDRGLRWRVNRDVLRIDPRVRHLIPHDNEPVLFEFDVLRGATEVIRAGRGRLQWIVEMHPDEWPRFGVEARGVAAMLQEMGLRVEHLRPSAGEFAEGDHALLTDL